MFSLTKTIIENAYGGGNQAFVDETEVHLQGGLITNAFGGGNSAAVSDSILITENGSTITSGLYGGTPYDCRPL